MIKRFFIFALLIALCCTVAVSLAEDWICPECGNHASGKFCNECGAARPVAEKESNEQAERINQKKEDEKVKEPKAGSDTIVFKEDHYSVSIGNSVKAMAMVKIKGNTDLEWSSSNEAVAVVSDKGEIKGVSAGEAVITARLVDNKDIANSCRVTVVAQIKKIAFEDKSLDLAANIPVKLAIKTEPENMPNSVLVWSSSNERVATVDKEGIVTGVAKGSAKITATAADNKKIKASITVKVDNYDIVFTDLSSKEESLYTSSAGGEKIKVSTKNKCVDVRMTGIGTTITASGFYYMTTFTITPIKAGVDTITFKYGNKMTYKVFVSPSAFAKPEPVEEKKSNVE